MDLDMHRTLLESFAVLPEVEERPPTFMEIEGYPHYENVCSNVLAFYLDPSRQHRLGSLLLEALLRASGVPSDVTPEVTSVEREAVTEKGSRIDILIEADSAIIAIENKIFAGVNNPFDDYSEFVNGRASEGQDQYKILLTMYPSNDGRESGFVNLTYADLIGRVRSSLGEFALEADTKYLMHFLDFLSTIEHFGEGTRMDERLIGLFAEKQDEVNDFMKSTWRIKDEMRGKVKDVLKLLSVEDSFIVYANNWRPKVNVEDFVYVDVRFPDMQVATDAILSPSGWTFRLFQRFPGKKNLQVLGQYLEEADIVESQRVKGTHTYLEQDFPYEEPLSNIAEFVQNIVDSLLVVSRDAHELHEKGQKNT